MSNTLTTGKILKQHPFWVGLSLLQTGPMDQHISGAHNRIGKNPKIMIWSLNFPPPT